VTARDLESIHRKAKTRIKHISGLPHRIDIFPVVGSMFFTNDVFYDCRSYSSNFCENRKVKRFLINWDIFITSALFGKPFGHVRKDTGYWLDRMKNAAIEEPESPRNLLHFSCCIIYILSAPRIVVLTKHDKLERGIDDITSLLRL
jgi:hypothetical protein